MISRIFLFLFCSIGFAADCVPVAGERILAGDLARAVPAFASVAPEVVLGYAPSPWRPAHIFRRRTRAPRLDATA